MLSLFGLRDESLRAAGRILLARETQADLILPCTFRTLVDDNQQHQHRNENKGGQRTQLRCQSAFARIGVDVGGERFQPLVPMVKMVTAKSSIESVKARMKPLIMPGSISGRITLRNA